ncbi:Hypothetical predicted protein [Lecanosticta acicola]|uniref:Uncharacterized protein n=1 Tax=Lecanosticta acicola TaxID=111012 RepID=A0AAI8W1N8_9PEZI|nr:Hypothetical predicted protein [Lecanosticta acicola]
MVFGKAILVVTSLSAGHKNKDAAKFPTAEEARQAFVKEHRKNDSQTCPQNRKSASSYYRSDGATTHNRSGVSEADSAERNELPAHSKAELPGDHPASVRKTGTLAELPAGDIRAELPTKERLVELSGEPKR